MIEDMTARKLGSHTQKNHIYSCKRFAAFLRRSSDTATADVSSRCCPCCGGRMVIIETFTRGCQPMHRPTTPELTIRIDTS